MRAVFLAPLVVLAATVSGIGTSVASPLNSLIEIGARYYDGYQPADCHNPTHNHYVPEWGIKIPHHHSQVDCRPIRDENDFGRIDRYDYRPWHGWEPGHDRRRHGRRYINRRY